MFHVEHSNFMFHTHETNPSQSSTFTFLTLLPHTTHPFTNVHPKCIRTCYLFPGNIIHPNFV